MLYILKTLLLYKYILYLLQKKFIHAIKYPYLVNLFIIINMLLYSYLVIESFNFGNLTIESYTIIFYNYITNLTSYNFLYGLYLFSLFL